MGLAARPDAVSGLVRHLAVPTAPILPGMLVGLYAIDHGGFEAPCVPEHRLLVQMGPPARTDCRIAGRHQNRLQVHGDIDVLPAGSSGVWEIDPAAIFIRFRFTPALLQATASDIGLNPDRVGLAPQMQARDPQIEHLASALHAALTSGVTLERLYAESLGTAVVARLISRFTSAAPVMARGGLSRRQLQRVIDYIETHTDQSLSLEDLAAVAGLSVSHFKTQFRQSMGMPAHRYVVQRRVEKAKTLLMEGRAISQVALDAGFAHQSHMARCMRQMIGLSPTDVARLAG